MPQDLINEQVDIYKLPVVDAQHLGVPGSQITIGDLHGNAMKLLFMLIKHGIATHINEADYETLVRIYQITETKFRPGIGFDFSKNKLKEIDLLRFNRILAKIEFKNTSTLRLIGDEMADRGSNDYFTLKILEKLKEHQVPVEILLSNHSVEFIEAYETQTDFKPPRLSREHAVSMFNLQNLLDQGLVSRGEILALVNKAYKPALRAISYSINEDKTEIFIYSHAGIGLNTIKSLAKKLNVVFNDKSASELAQTIDRINTVFQEYVQTNTIYGLYHPDVLRQGYFGRSISEEARPLEFIMWNRDYSGICNARPEQWNGYQLNFVHGHDQKEATRENIYNLDNGLGKFDEHEGRYTVLYTHGLPQPEALARIDEEPVLEPRGRIIPSDRLAQFDAQMALIDGKRQELLNNQHVLAADAAELLHFKIATNFEDFLQHKIDHETFNTNCSDAMIEARVELEQHRGWKGFLGNLALAIFGLGVFYAAAALVNKAVNGNFLFFRTDSANKVDQLAKAIDAMAPVSQS